VSWALRCEVQPVYTTEWECSTGWEAVQSAVIPHMGIDDALLLGGAIVLVWAIAWTVGVTVSTILRRY